MSFEIINPASLAAPLGPYSYGAKVTSSNLIFLAGAIATNEENEIVGIGDIAAQARQIFENIKICLESAGSGLHNIVKMTTYLTDFDQYSDIVPVREEYFSPPYPAATGIEVPRLIVPEALIEVEVIATY